MDRGVQRDVEPRSCAYRSWWSLLPSHPLLSIVTSSWHPAAPSPPVSQWDRGAGTTHRARLVCEIPWRWRGKEDFFTPTYT